MGRRGLLGDVRHGVRLLCLQTGVSRIGANRVLVYQYLISITGVASGIIFFGEVLGVEKIVGGAVTLLGVYMARRQ